MNHWMDLSIQYANQRSYLDDLFTVYPTIPDGVREIDKKSWNSVEKAFKQKNNGILIEELLKLDLFPIKDSYVAYLKRDKKAIARNPQTINRICGRIYEMGLSELFKRCSEPKETNRQIGQHFRRWINNKSLGIAPVKLDRFLKDNKNAILDGGDAELMHFAAKHLNYKRDKGLDLVARFNGKYVIGEAKFLSDFGGHQNAQFSDALATLNTPNVKATTIAILDGVLYITGKNKMYKTITQGYKKSNIMSSLVLREFLYQL